jgi:hypothetical protein
MAARNKAIAVLIDTSIEPSVLIKREQEFDPLGGSADVQTALASGRQIISLYIVRDLDGDMGGPFWDEYSGNSQYRVESVFDGVDVGERDLTGGTQGVRTRTYFSNATAPAARVEVSRDFEDSTMGRGSGWTVYQDGQGAEYEAQLAAARELVGVPA